MATVDFQTIDAEVIVFPFTGITAVARQQSGIARAQVTLKFPQTTLAGGAAGTLTCLRMEGRLPRNFAYAYVGGSLKIGRVAAAAIEDQARGVFFENEALCGITGTTFADSWKMLNEGVYKQELDVNLSAGNFVSVNTATRSSTATHATPGTYNGGQDLYQKVYKDANYPRILYRGENGDILVTADIANMVESPIPAAQYLALGELHFLQYDIDQAYNYLIHSPVPVR